MCDLPTQNKLATASMGLRAWRCNSEEQPADPSAESVMVAVEPIPAMNIFGADDTISGCCASNRAVRATRHRS